jgi:AMMECR1 domain-containing protein
LKLRLEKANIVKSLIELDEYIYIFETEIRKEQGSEEIFFEQSDDNFHLEGD